MNKNLFGTDGIRALIGADCFTDTSIIQLAHALSIWITHTYGHHATVLIGNDTRNSCSWIKHTLIAILNRHGHTSYDAQVVPTPIICWLTSNANLFDCGIIISASHNAWDYNGIKIYDAFTGKIKQSAEELITHYFYNPTVPPLQTIMFGSNVSYNNSTALYTTALVTLFEPHMLKGLTIVLDCANGATSLIAHKIFTQLGATTIMINDNPNGTNINDQCGALYPEILQKKVLAHHADIGFSFDGDGDRVIAVNAQGIIKDGDDILALLASHPLYKNTKTIISTIMANYGLQRYLQNYDISLIQTDVGDKHVAAALKKHNVLLGGEQSGHIILTDFLCTGDGIFTALRIVETMLVTKNMTFSTFDKYPQVVINVTARFKKEITSPEMQTPLQHYQAQLPVGRILVRYSGTEPLLRVMVECIDKEIATDVGTQLAQKYHNILNQ